jgi:biotin transporter BioY
LSQPAAKPGSRDGSTPVMITLAGFIVGLALFIAFGVESSLYGVLPFALGGLVVGAVAAALWSRRRRRA